MFDEPEIEALARNYGQPVYREQDIEADDYLYASRSYRSQSRRGEVVMVVERDPDLVLVHTKSWYKPPVLRLLSGGVGPDESIEAAFSRELSEETGYELDPLNFLAFHRCHLNHADEQLTFDSCIIKATAPNREPHPNSSDEAIQSFKWIPVRNLRDIAEDLRSTPPPRKAWGYWRALSHDLVFEILDNAQVF
jgi:ADP-ribose pyrophosphatase YjhB (NUDIX family)